MEFISAKKYFDRAKFLLSFSLAKETLSVRYLRLSIRWGWEIFIFSYFRVNKDQIYRSLSAIKFPKDRMLEWL